MDLVALMRAHPELAGFTVMHPLAGMTIDFADPAAVKALNCALLRYWHGISTWDLPAGHLCPPIPSRADYLFHVADLPGIKTRASLARIRMLDVGTGASVIYPLLAASIHGWSSVGTDIDPYVLAWARDLVAANPSVAGKIELRLQPSPQAIFDGVVRRGDAFTLSVCNPPFHSSLEEARAGTERKLRNLGGGRRQKETTLNFGGVSNELWCEGGEVGFIRRMIVESARHPHLCDWFTTLVSKSASLRPLERVLAHVRPRDWRVISMAAGQKRSRILAWTFRDRTSFGG